LRHAGDDDVVLDFFPYGYDERQFCSPGFNLPIGCVMRTPYAQYPEYHTSADDLSFIRPRSLADSFVKCLEALYILEHNRKFLNQNPKGEPQLGKRGLYRTIGGQSDRVAGEFAMLWVLNLSDGCHTLLDIAERSGLPFSTIKKATDALTTHDLLKECPERMG
jgi:aminopeptidase-like protein